MEIPACPAFGMNRTKCLRNRSPALTDIHKKGGGRVFASLQKARPPHDTERLRQSNLYLMQSVWPSTLNMELNTSVQGLTIQH